MKRYATALTFLVAIAITAALTWTLKHRLDHLARPEPTQVSDSLADIKKRLETIRIKEVNFQNADIIEVVDFLQDESRRLDPEGVGVNIIVREIPPGLTIRSLRLRDIKFLDVIKVICDLANMRYVVEPKAVVIVPMDPLTSHGFETLTYDVSPAVIVRIVTLYSPSTSADATVTAVPDGLSLGNVKVDSRLLVNALEQLGVPFPPGASAHYLAAHRRIVITNTRQNNYLSKRILQEVEMAMMQDEAERALVSSVGREATQQLAEEFLQLRRAMLDPEQLRFRADIIEAERKCELLAKKYRETRDEKTRAELRQQLQELLVKIFELKETAREKEIVRGEKAVAQQRVNLNADKKRRSELIQSRLEELTKPQPKP